MGDLMQCRKATTAQIVVENNRHFRYRRVARLSCSKRILDDERQPVKAVKEPQPSPAARRALATSSDAFTRSINFLLSFVVVR